MKKIVVIGGGVTGLSVAWKLSEKGYEVKVIEMDEFIGGLARSIKMGNYFFDIGPHAFTTKDEEVFKKVMDLFKSEPGEMLYTKRTVKMMFRGKYVDYPLSVKVLFQMGIMPAIMCSLSFLKSKIRTSINSLLGKKTQSQNLTVKQWAIDSFGKYLYLNFFKPYTEQFWKIETSELSDKVIPSRTRTDFALLYLIKAFKHALINKYLELSKREPGKLSLVERESLPSYYPKKGFGEIANRIGKQIKSNGGEIYTSQEVDEIILNSNNTFNVYFYIDEGLHYDFNLFHIDTQIENINLDQIEHINTIVNDYYLKNISKKNFYNESKINKLTNIISDYLYDIGLIFFEIQVLENIEDTNVDILYKIIEAQPKYVDQINIFGNTRTIEKVIRREITVAEGDAINSDKIRTSNNNLKRLDIFRNVSIEEKSGKDNYVDLDVNVEEKSQKRGISPKNENLFVNICKNGLSLNKIGLIFLPPIDDNPEKYFLHLNQLRNQTDLCHLSMGMSNDYQTAIKCGSTFLRIGSKILGERNTS